MTGQEQGPRWPPQFGPEALFKGLRGEKGDKGEPGVTPRTRRAFTYLLVTAGLLASAALIIGVRQINAFNTQEARLSHLVQANRHRVLAQCRFDADIGTAPLTANPAGKVPRLAVSIVADARLAWHGLGCPGTITPASAVLRKWAAYYHIPIWAPTGSRLSTS